MCEDKAVEQIEKDKRLEKWKRGMRKELSERGFIKSQIDKVIEDFLFDISKNRDTKC